MSFDKGPQTRYIDLALLLTRRLQYNNFHLMKEVLCLNSVHLLCKLAQEVENKIFCLTLESNILVSQRKHNFLKFLRRYRDIQEEGYMKSLRFGIVLCFRLRQLRLNGKNLEMRYKE